MLKDKNATTFPTVFPELDAMGVMPERKAIVAHGSIATGGGCLAGVELAAWLVEGLLTKKAAEAVTASFARIE